MSSPSVNLENEAALERPHGALRRYEKLKSELAEIGQAGMQLCRELHDQETERLYQSLLARIAEDRFNLAVLGHFNRGKSTLMNAILGMDRLPTGVLPRTSVVTTVVYGSPERVLVRCAGWALTQEMPLEKLADYVTEQGNPGNQRQVTLAEIHLPSEILRRGFSFIDTPGVASGIAANTAATQGFIPEIDAAIFVTSVESPMSEDEFRFLRRVHEEVGAVFVVLNKLDLMPQPERGEIVRFVTRRLDSELGPSNYRLFAVSAKAALDAKLHGDAIGLARSGVPEVEGALTEFLRTNKTWQFCHRTLERLVALLRRQQAELAISLAASNLSDSAAELRDQFSQKVKELSEHASATASRLRIKLSAEIANAVSEPLNSFLGELAERTRQIFLSKLSARSVLFHRPQSERLLREAAAFCEGSIGEWVAAAGTLRIQPAIEKLGGETLIDFVRLPEDVPKLAAELVGSRTDLPRQASADDDHNAIECDFSLPRLSHVSWTRRPPLRLCLAPYPWLEAAVRAWFKDVCDAAADEYREQLKALITACAQDYIDILAREVQRKITESGSRIAGYIGSEQQLDNVAVVEGLLQRTANLQEQLNGSSSAALDGFDPTKRETDPASEADTALATEPCSVCERAAGALFAFLSKHQYAISADGAAQASHAASGGFCALHTWMYSELTSPQGICRAYPGLLTSLSRRLLKGVEAAWATDDLEVMCRRILRQADDCPACSVIAAVEREAAAHIIARYADPSIASADLPILCLTHLYTVLKLHPLDRLARVLTERTAKALERSAENMRCYALKHDAIRRNLLTHEERIAHVLGLARLVRDKRLAPRWTKDEL
jgi:GTP-binding protein EngB required for normal cell division